MIFENVMSEHLYEIRNKLHQLGIKYPEVGPHFGLSHSGLIDNETEKLAEAFSFKLTMSECYRKSTITNLMKPFMEVHFPQWFRPEVSSFIVEFNNFDDYESISNYLSINKLMNYEFSKDGKQYFLSSNEEYEIHPFTIEKSYFTVSETLTHCYLSFKNQMMESDIKIKPEIKIYLNSFNYEEILHLISYIFDPKFKDKNLLIKTKDKEYEINRKNISLSIDGIKNKIKNVFYNNENKLSIINDVLNRLNHFFYIVIDLSSINLNQEETFLLDIPLLSEAYQNFSKLTNFAKTNCFPVYDIYKKDLNAISLYEINEDSKISISNLKDDNLISVIEAELYEFSTKEYSELPSHLYVESSIQFTPSIPYNIEHTLIFKNFVNNSDSFFISNGIFSNLFQSKFNIINEPVSITGKINLSFGKIITKPTETIFYSEILSDSEFFNFIYNWDYFIGKKMANLDMIITYVEKIKPLFFNYKNTFIKYIEEIKIEKWEMVAKMNSKGKPTIISRYKLKNTENKVNYFYDRILEKIMDSLAETDLVYEIVRI